MIAGIGIDAVDIQRFTHWYTYSRARLSRIFTEKEIAYCLENPTLTTQRFAGRFALKEASFKAWHNAGGKPVPFLSWCTVVESYQPGKLSCNVNHNFNILSSLTHTDSTAIAFVILEKVS